MKRCQKITLLLLGTLNVIAIGLIGSTIWKSAPPASPNTLPSNPCPNMILADLPDHLSPAVAWESDRLHITLLARYTVPTPPASSVQNVWVALDGLRRAIRSGCALPPEIRVLVNAQGTNESHGTIASIPTESVRAWIAGDITEETLAAQAVYRPLGQATLSETQPRPSPYPR